MQEHLVHDGPPLGEGLKQFAVLARDGDVGHFPELTEKPFPLVRVVGVRVGVAHHHRVVLRRLPLLVDRLHLLFLQEVADQAIQQHQRGRCEVVVTVGGLQVAVVREGGLAVGRVGVGAARGRPHRRVVRAHRRAQLQQRRRRWQRAVDGHGQVVVGVGAEVGDGGQEQQPVQQREPEEGHGLLEVQPDADPKHSHVINATAKYGDQFRVLFFKCGKPVLLLPLATREQSSVALSSMSEVSVVPCFFFVVPDPARVYDPAEKLPGVGTIHSHD
mmetsp:Transcript_10142/g.16396  ORF Transcript_10142/g.16396 Transcript_10142/m.16396 type:complete len:273 (+) Transcript_10142:2049-2867(+)